MSGAGSLYQRRSIPLFEGGSPVDEKQVQIAGRSFVILERDVSCTMKIGDLGAPEMDAAPGEYGVQPGAPNVPELISHIYLTAVETASAGDELDIVVPRGLYASVIGDKFSGAVAEAAPATILATELLESLSAGTSRLILDRIPVPAFTRIFAQVSEGDNQVIVKVEAFDEDGNSLGTASDTAGSGAAAGVELSDSDMDTLDVSVEAPAGGGGLSQAAYLVVGFP